MAAKILPDSEANWFLCKRLCSNLLNTAFYFYESGCSAWHHPLRRTIMLKTYKQQFILKGKKVHRDPAISATTH
jgi:hypothetical protein